MLVCSCTDICVCTGERSGGIELSSLDAQLSDDQASALATRMLKLEVLSDELQWVGHVGPDCDVVNFLCQLPIRSFAAWRGLKREGET